VRKSVGPVGVAGSTLDLLNDGHEVNKTPYRFQVCLDALVADAFIEIEPSDMFGGHGASLQLTDYRNCTEYRTALISGNMRG
jgi:hypothetical protein